MSKGTHLKKFQSLALLLSMGLRMDHSQGTCSGGSSSGLSPPFGHTHGVKVVLWMPCDVRHMAFEAYLQGPHQAKHACFCTAAPSMQTMASAGSSGTLPHGWRMRVREHECTGGAEEHMGTGGA